MRLADSLSNPPTPLLRLWATRERGRGLRVAEAISAAVAQAGVDDPSTVRLEVDEQRKLTPAEVQELVEAYRHGASQTELGRRFGIHRQTVGRYLAKQHVERRSRRPLDESQQLEAVRLYVDQTWTLAEIAKKFGVAQNSIRNVLLRHGIERRSQARRKGRY